MKIREVMASVDADLQESSVSIMQEETEAEETTYIWLLRSYARTFIGQVNRVIEKSLHFQVHVQVHNPI